MTARNLAFDYAKGFGILVVVFAHLWRGLAGAGLLKGIDANVFHAVSSICTIVSMPAFFLVSGLLYGASMHKRHGLLEFSGKVDAIFYPYIIWATIIGLFEVLGSGVRNGHTAYSDLLFLLWSPRGIFWFLYVLLMAFLLIEVVIAIVGVARAPVVLLIISLALLLAYPHAPAIFCLREFCMSLVYFALGIFFANRVPKAARPSWPMFIITACVLVVFEYWVSMVLGLRTQSTRSITPEIFWVGAVSLTLVMVAFYSLPDKGMGWLAELGVRSMDIYLVHILFVASIRILMDKVMGIQSAWAYFVLCMLFGILGSLYVTALMKRGPLKYLFQPPPFLSMKARILSFRAGKLAPTA